MNVIVVDPARVIFEGNAHNVILPGEKGVFEILPFHKNLLSRLAGGLVSIDGRFLFIRRGIAKVESDVVTVIVEGARWLHHDS